MTQLSEKNGYEEYTREELEALNESSTGKLVLDCLTVLIINAIPMYGVFFRGWDGFSLILLYICEGLIVWVTDILKFSVKNTGITLDKNFKKSGSTILGFEFIFITFFGAFALIAFGPRESASLVLSETFIPVKDLILTELKWPLAGILIFRCQKLFQDYVAAGGFGRSASIPLCHAGGGWMILLFAVVMLVPFISGGDANPRAGLAAIVTLKTVGELFGVWAVRLALKLEDKATAEKKHRK